jgi:hypothetical protein
MAYLMDSNALIQAKNQFYRFGFCPGFWDWIAAENAHGALYSIVKVKEELEDGQDELAHWAGKVIPASFFVGPSASVVTTFGVVSQWVKAQPVYSPQEQARFLSKADPWLIAEAIQNKHKIITFEDLVPPNSTKVKIPNVATNFGVQTVSLFDVLEASGARLRL